MKKIILNIGVYAARRVRAVTSPPCDMLLHRGRASAKTHRVAAAVLGAAMCGAAGSASATEPWRDLDKLDISIFVDEFMEAAEEYGRFFAYVRDGAPPSVWRPVGRGVRRYSLVPVHPPSPDGAGNRFMLEFISKWSPKVNVTLDIVATRKACLLQSVDVTLMQEMTVGRLLTITPVLNVEPAGSLVQLLTPRTICTHLSGETAIVAKAPSFDLLRLAVVSRMTDTRAATFSNLTFDFPATALEARK